MVKLINAYTLSECLEAMAGQIAAYEQLGQKNVVFCEDRLTLVAERALMRKIGGTLLTNVTTFSRFLKTDQKVLSREGSVMAVGDIMLEKQAAGQMKCFTSSGSVIAGAKCIYEQLAQFAASELSPKQLQEGVARLPDDALKNKMSDLALLYESYDEFLKREGFLDEGKYLTLLPDCIKNTEGMSETNVFFLCYSSFTKQAKRTLAAAIENAKNVVGIFLAGEEELYTNQAYGAFAQLAQQYAEQKRCVYKAYNFGTPLDGEAERLRQCLFAAESLSEKARAARLETDAIRIFAAPDRAGEAEYAAVYIRKRMLENPDLHYRDFAVLVPDVGEYSLALRKAFSEYGIPYSMDERISLKRHPLSKFILAVIEAVTERFSPACIDGVAKNVFFGDGDDYRNYLLKHGNFRGGALKPIKAAAAEEFGGSDYLNDCKQKLERALGLFKDKRLGKEYCQAVESLMEAFSVGQVLNELVLEAEDEGLRSYLSQIEKKIDGVLAEAKLLAGEKAMDLEDFATILADGLEATEIAPNPLRLDAVFVGDLTDSRIERVRTLFALGMTDAVPRASDDANLITDQDKLRLQEIQAYLEPMVEEVNLRNRESLGLNLCTFTDGLYLTYALGSNGEDPALSDVFRYVKSSFITTAGEELKEEKKIPDADFAYRCGAIAPAIRQLLLQKNDYEEKRTDSRREFSSLYTALERQNALPEGVNGERILHKYIKEGETLFLSHGALSPSLLETYFDCPYKCFASRGLYLEERQEQTVLSTDTGNFIHKLLEEITDQIRTAKDEESFAKLALDRGRELLNDEKLLPREDTLAGVYSTEKLLEEGVQIARAVYRQVCDSAFDTISKERKIRTADVHGKVDRVDENDEYVRVVDYKTGGITADPKSYYVGLKLQMELYMSAVRGDKIPAGVLYFPASVSFSETAEGKFRMQGFLNGDVGALRCGDTTISGEQKSEHFDAALEKNRGGNVMPGDMFTDFLDYAVYLSRGATKELREGYVAPSPVKTSKHHACTWCKFGGMCGFHQERLEVRSVPRTSSKQIVEVVRKRKEEDKGNE